MARLCRLGFVLRFGLWNSQNRGGGGLLLVGTQVQALFGLETIHQLQGSLHMDMNKLSTHLHFYVPNTSKTLTHSYIVLLYIL